MCGNNPSIESQHYIRDGKFAINGRVLDVQQNTELYTGFVQPRNSTTIPTASNPAGFDMYLNCLDENHVFQSIDWT